MNAQFSPSFEEELSPTLVAKGPGAALTGYTVRRLTPKDSGDPTTADATIDRLREMCAAIVTTGESWRSK